MSQKPRQGKDKTTSLSKKIFTKSNITKVFFPSLALLLIILTPVVFEAFKTRHQQINDVIEAPSPGDLIDDIFGPSGDINFENDTDDGLMNEYIEGVPIPDRVLFRVTPSDHYFNWRYEVYDTYTLNDWENDLSTSEATVGSGSIYLNDILPANADGELFVTQNISYIGGSYAGKLPAPYHYYYKEQFNNDSLEFLPTSNWLSSVLEIDNYDAMSVNVLFENQFGNSTINYPVAYTLQDNEYIKDNSAGFTQLNSLISSDPDLTNRYLQLPDNYDTLAPLTNQIASDLLNPSSTIYNQVFRNMVWLNRNNSYDLDILSGISTETPDEGEDHVEWFLTRREGTAVHFAASLAIICRLQNIPSRLVIGFSYGDRIGSDFVIRSKHIHTWVEVFIPMGGVGYWVAFDPSPLIPGLRDYYGENTIGFEAAFYCSNEFFLEPQHMIRNAVYPYFEPNPFSSAWYEDPYNPGNWYGPYVNRSDTFTLYAFLGNGNDYDLLNYLITGTLGNLEPIEGELITFIDTTNGSIIGTNYTDSSGFATYDYSFTISDDSGLHNIIADWIGIQVPTYDLRYIPVSYVETGVFVTSSVSIGSLSPNELSSIIFDKSIISENVVLERWDFSFNSLSEIVTNIDYLKSFLSKIILLFRSY